MTNPLPRLAPVEDPPWRAMIVPTAGTSALATPTALVVGTFTGVVSTAMWTGLDSSHGACGGRARRLRCGSDNHIRACTPDRVPELTCALGPDSAGAVLTAALTR